MIKVKLNQKVKKNFNCLFTLFKTSLNLLTLLIVKKGAGCNG